MSSNVKLSRTAKEVKKYSIVMKAASIVVLSLIVLVAVTYLASYLYDQFGSFTVSVNKYDMVKQGLTLSETPEFDYPIAKLNAKAVKNITNISGNDLPGDVNMINGSHNGNNYVAYTFYVANSGENTVTYEYSVNIKSVTQDVDSAIRVRIYKNGEEKTFARTKADGTGPEFGTQEFLTASIMARERFRDFAPGESDKYTVVIWLDGDDPECTDNIVGGRIKIEMEFNIVEGS